MVSNIFLKSFCRTFKHLKPCRIYCTKISCGRIADILTFQKSFREKICFFAAEIFRNISEMFHFFNWNISEIFLKCFCMGIQMLNVKKCIIKFCFKKHFICFHFTYAFNFGTHFIDEMLRSFSLRCFLFMSKSALRRGSLSTKMCNLLYVKDFRNNLIERFAKRFHEMLQK